MDKFEISERDRGYIDGLKLVMRRGLSAARVEDSALIDLPVVREAAGSAVSPGARARVFVQVLERIVDQVLVGRDQESARMLFALGQWAGSPMGERFEAVARYHNRRWKWDNYRKEPLSRFLMLVLNELYREGEPSTAISGSSVERIVGGDYRLTSYELYFNLPVRPGARSEALEIRELEATRPGVARWRQSYDYKNRNLVAPPEVTLFGPGSIRMLDDQVEQDHRRFISEVTFDSPLQNRERVRFGLLTRSGDRSSQVHRRGWRGREILTPVVPVAHAVIQVRFPPGKRPTRAWHLDAYPRWLVPGEPNEMNTIDIRDSDTATFVWSNLELGLSYGIAWEW